MMVLGLLLVAAALFLVVKNLREERAAEDIAGETLAALKQSIPENANLSEPELRLTDARGNDVEWPLDAAGEPLPWPVDVDGVPLPWVTDANGNAVYWPADAAGKPLPAAASRNLLPRSAENAGNIEWPQDADGALLPWVSDGGGYCVPWPVDDSGTKLGWAEIRAGWREFIRDFIERFWNFSDMPAFVRNPDMEMPVVMLGGDAYIGTLEVPKFDLELPVMSDWSYPGLKKAPCRYSGSIYAGDMVIAGHNYARHFSPIKQLQVGDEVRFTDVDGNVFIYQVAMTETLGKYAVDEMLEGEWELTLFTCTYGGGSRATVRCELKTYICP